MHWSERLEKVRAAIAERATLGEIKLASLPYVVAPLLLRPREKPLRGKPVNDWRLELLYKPAALSP